MLAMLVAEGLHGAQGPMVCGEARAGAEAHVVQGGRREGKTQVQAANDLLFFFGHPRILFPLIFFFLVKV